MEEQVFDGLDPQLIAALRILKDIRDAAKQAEKDLDSHIFREFDLDPYELSEGDYLSLPESAKEMWSISAALREIAEAEQKVQEYLLYLRTGVDTTPVTLEDDDLPF